MVKTVNYKKMLLFIVVITMTFIFVSFTGGFALLKLIKISKPLITYPKDTTSYDFSVDWFSHNLENWNKYKDFFEGNENSQCLEIGALEGRSTLYTVQNYCNSKNSKTYVIDTWEWPISYYTPQEQRDLFAIFSYNLRDYIKNKKVIPLRGESRKMLLKLAYEVSQNKLQKFDFVYICGSHLAKDYMFDMTSSWEMLKVDGIMAVAGYGWDKFKENPELTPKPAVDGFLKSYKGDYEILHKGFEVHLKKIR